MTIPTNLIRRLEALEARYHHTARDTEIEATIAAAEPMIEEQAALWDSSAAELRDLMREELIRARDMGHDAYWRDYSERHGVPLEICLDPDRFDEHVDQQRAEYQAWKAEVLSKQEWWVAGRHYIGGVLQD